MPMAQKKMPMPLLKYAVGHSPQMQPAMLSSVTGMDIDLAAERFVSAGYRFDD